jgi:hypothetical protein
LEFEHEIEMISTTLVAFSAPKSDEVPNELEGATGPPIIGAAIPLETVPSAGEEGG